MAVHHQNPTPPFDYFRARGGHEERERDEIVGSAGQIGFRVECRCEELGEMPNEMVEKLKGSIVMVNNHVYYQVAYTMDTECLIVEELITS